MFLLTLFFIIVVLVSCRKRKRVEVDWEKQFPEYYQRLQARSTPPLGPTAPGLVISQDPVQQEQTPPPDDIPSFQGRVAKVHDLDYYVEQIRGEVDTMCAAIPYLPDGDVVVTAGMVEKIKTIRTGKGEHMAKGILNDPTGRCEFTVFPDKLLCYPVNLGDIVVIRGYVKDHNLIVKTATVIGKKKSRLSQKKRNGKGNPNQVAFVVDES